MHGRSLFLAESLLLAVCIVPLGSKYLQAEKPSTSLIETIAGETPSDSKGKEFSFSAVAGLAADSSGNIFFTIQALNQVFRLSPDGHVTPYAGSGVRADSQENVAATSSPLNTPAGLAVDRAGDLYIHCPRRLLRVKAETREIATVLMLPYHDPVSGESIRSFGGMTFGPDGLLYFVDDRRIKSFDLDSGTIKSLTPEHGADERRPGESSTPTSFKYPHSVAVDSDGSVYFSTLEPAVFRIPPDRGKIEIVSLQINGEQPVSEMQNATALAVDGLGNLYVAQANSSRVLRIDVQSGDVTVFAGNGSQQFGGDGRKGTNATVALPGHIAVDAHGNLVVAERSRIQRVDFSSRKVTTIVGNGMTAVTAKSGPAVESRLWEPANAVRADDGNVYITSSFSNRLMRVDPQGRMSNVAGSENKALGDSPGPATQISLYFPQGIWVDRAGDIYFTDRDNRVLRRLRRHAVENFAVTPKNSNSAGMYLYYAAGLVGDDHYFYMSDPTGHRVWRISRMNGFVDPWAGTGNTVPLRYFAAIPDGTPAPEANLISPSGLALDSAGNLYIADGGYMKQKLGRILRVSPDGNISTVLSGLQQPSGLAFESRDVLCFSEVGANQVRCLNLTSGSIRVAVGNGIAGFQGDGGPAECAELDRPQGISFDREGTLYIADTGNQRVRRVHLGSAPLSCSQAQAGK